MKNRFLCILLTLCMVVSLCPTAWAANVAANTSNTSNKYSSDWVYWSQGASKYPRLRSSGCRLVAQSKLLRETGAVTSSSFNPDMYYDWCGKKGYFATGNSISELKYALGPGAYASANGTGVTIKYVKKVSFSTTDRTARCNLIMDYFKQGYYIILGCADHQAYVSRNASLQKNTPVIYDSWTKWSYNTSVVQNYSSYKQVAFNYILLFQASNTPINPSGGGTSSSTPIAAFSAATDSKYTAKASVSNTNAVVVSQVTKNAGVAVTYTGLYLYDEAGNLIKKYSAATTNVGNSTTKFHVWFDINAELGVTLTSGTTYRYKFFGIFNGSEIDGPMGSFTTTGTKPATYYTLTLDPNGGQLNPTTFRLTSQDRLGSTLNSNIPSRSGYTFAGWYDAPEGGNAVSNDAFLVADWTVYAHWIKDEPEKYEVLFFDILTGISYGTRTVTNGEPYGTLPTPTKSGYMLDGWYTSATGGTKVTSSTIVNLTKDQTLYVRWIQISFIDVKPGDWFAPSVSYTVERGLMKGTGNSMFSPNGTITRGEILTILARHAGVNTDGSNPWYQAGTDWARANNVSDGQRPLEQITRAELATLLYRCAKSPAVSTSQLNRWPDASSVPSGAVSALAWCVENGIINGTDKGTLLPLGTANRAQVAAMVQRYCTILDN